VVRFLAVSSFIALALGACGGDEIVIEAAIPDETGAPAPLAGLRLVEPFNEYLRVSAALTRVTDSATRRMLEDSVTLARQRLSATRDRLDPAIDTERVRIRAWEDTALRSYDSIGGSLVRQSYRDAIVDSTRADGRTRIKLKGKPWWVTARAVMVSDPNREWYWNLRVSGDTVRLDAKSGRAVPRL
jgi:hypothetical protein